MQIADDPEQDLPVKDINSHRSGVMAPPPLSHSFEGRATLPNQLVSKLNRGELEDRFLNMRDENLHLKKVCNQHEEKIRRLASKLLRVVCEQKDRLPTAERRRDYDFEKVVEEQEVRINELEQCNSNLQERLVVLRQQLSSHSRLHSAVHCAPPRCTLRSHSQQRVSSSSLHQNESFRESGRAAEQEQELSNLREQEHQFTAEVTMLRQEVQRLEQELRMVREESTARATELAEELASSAVEEQRQKVSENVELIRVKRVMKQQSAQILSLQTRNQALEHELSLVRESLEHSQHSNDDLHQEVLAEKQKVVELQQEVAKMSSCQLAIKELQAQIIDHQKEKAALKDHNQQLLSLSANSIIVESNTGEDERVSLLERTLATKRSELSDAKTSMEELKNRSETMEEENKQLKASCEQLESQLMGKRISSLELKKDSLDLPEAVPVLFSEEVFEEQPSPSGMIKDSSVGDIMPSQKLLTIQDDKNDELVAGESSSYAQPIDLSENDSPRRCLPFPCWNKRRHSHTSNPLVVAPKQWGSTPQDIKRSLIFEPSQPQNQEYSRQIIPNPSFKKDISLQDFQLLQLKYNDSVASEDVFGTDQEAQDSNLEDVSLQELKPSEEISKDTLTLHRGSRKEETKDQHSRRESESSLEFGNPLWKVSKDTLLREHKSLFGIEKTPAQEQEPLRENGATLEMKTSSLTVSKNSLTDAEKAATVKKKSSRYNCPGDQNSALKLNKESFIHKHETEIDPKKTAACDEATSREDMRTSRQIQQHGEGISDGDNKKSSGSEDIVLQILEQCLHIYPVHKITSRISSSSESSMSDDSAEQVHLTPFLVKSRKSIHLSTLHNFKTSNEVEIKATEIQVMEEQVKEPHEGATDDVQQVIVKEYLGMKEEGEEKQGNSSLIEILQRQPSEQYQNPSENMFGIKNEESFKKYFNNVSNCEYINHPCRSDVVSFQTLQYEDHPVSQINMPTVVEESFGPDDEHMEADIVTMAETSDSQHSIVAVHPLISGGDLDLPFPTCSHEPAQGGSRSICEEVSPPVIVDDERRSVTSLSQVNHDVVNKMAATSSDNKIKLLSHLEAARELKKCQEMLRVQYNLNILYKKEVDNLGQKLYQCTLQNAVKHHKR